MTQTFPMTEVSGHGCEKYTDSSFSQGFKTVNMPLQCPGSSTTRRVAGEPRSKMA